MRTWLLVVILITLLAAVTTALLLVYYHAPGKAYERVVIDALGRRVSLPSEVKRIVTLSPAATEIVYALGAGDRVVGVDKYSNYPPELVKAVKEGKVKIVGDYWSPSLEKIVELSPDLVIADSGVPKHVSLAERLHELGIPVLFLRGGRAQSIDDVLYDIMLVGRSLGLDAKAEKLVEELRSEIASVSRRLTELNTTKPVVLVVYGAPEWGLWVAGGGTFVESVIEAAGGRNAASKYHGWVQLSYEDVIAADPTVIVVEAMGGRKGALEALKAWSRTPLNETRAFREGRVCVVFGMADDVLSRPGPRIGVAVKVMAYILYPQVFRAPKGYEDYIICRGAPS